MRILLTGVTGQVGGALAQRLAEHELVLADRNVLDFSQPQSIAPALDRLAADLIINPAAYTAVDRAENECELAMRINAEAPGIIARWAATRDVPLIHFSTEYVFDGSGVRPWKEDDPTAPLSVYGGSKRAGENEICAAGGTFLIVRTSWVYSAKGRNFVRAIAQRAVEQCELRVVADQVGAPTSANSIADVIQRMLVAGPAVFRDRCREANGLVHFAAAGETSWHGFAVAIMEGLKSRGLKLAAERIVPIRASEYLARAKRPSNSRLDCSRLKQIFGLSAPVWEQPLERELDILADDLR